VAEHFSRVFGTDVRNGLGVVAQQNLVKHIYLVAMEQLIPVNLRKRSFPSTHEAVEDSAGTFIT
jgi:hypothetical protein